MATDSIDLEKGLISASLRPTNPSPTSSGAGKADNPSVHTPLQLFQLLVGIDTPLSLTQNGTRTLSSSARSRSDNVGLYQRAKDRERQSRMQYTTTSIISNSLFMLQILFAAVYTALSAYKGAPRTALTVLGAANTVIAG